MGLIVTGMHRSGTSAVARCLDALGVTTGEGRLMPPAAENPRGFFERLDVADLDDAWLERLGGSWWAPPEVSPRTWSRLDDDLIQQDRSNIDVLADPTACWFLKDPRISLLLPLWDRLALTRLPVVVVVRSPAEVAGSLTMRNGTGRLRSQALWMEYVLRLITDAGADRPSLLLDFGELLADPDRTVRSLADFVRTTQHVDVPADFMGAAVAALEPGLQRHGRDDEQPLGLKEPLELYHALAKYHGESVPLDFNPARPAWLDETLDEFRELRGLRVAAQQAHTEAAVADDARDGEAQRWQDHTGMLRHELDYVREERTDLRARLDALADVRRDRDVAQEREAAARQWIAHLEAEVSASRSRLEQLTATADALSVELAGLRPRLELLADAREQAAFAAEKERLAVERIGVLEGEVARRQAKLDEVESTGAQLDEEVTGLRQQLAAGSALSRRISGELEAARSRLSTIEDQQASQVHQKNALTARAAQAEAGVLELEMQADDLAKAAASRRDALWAMTKELERHRAAAVNARRTVPADDPTTCAPTLVPAETGRSAIESLLAVAKHERDGLESALRIVIKEKQQATGELAMVRASRGYRWTRWLAARPSDTPGRGGHDQPAG
jgi:uncharacterized coiled-coil DUF342 family protein